MFIIKSLRLVVLLAGILPILIIGGFFIIQSGINFPLFTITFFTGSLYLFLTIFPHLHYKDMLLDKLHLLQNEMRMKERLDNRYSVDTAENIKTGLTLFKQKQPQIVFTRFKDGRRT